jgi:hypothetical protein
MTWPRVVTPAILLTPPRPAQHAQQGMTLRGLTRYEFSYLRLLTLESSVYTG